MTPNVVSDSVSLVQRLRDLWKDEPATQVDFLVNALFTPSSAKQASSTWDRWSVFCASRNWLPVQVSDSRLDEFDVSRFSSRPKPGTLASFRSQVKKVARILSTPFSSLLSAAMRKVPQDPVSSDRKVPDLAPVLSFLEDSDTPSPGVLLEQARGGSAQAEAELRMRSFALLMIFCGLRQSSVANAEHGVHKDDRGFFINCRDEKHHARQVRRQQILSHNNPSLSVVDTLQAYCALTEGDCFDGGLSYLALSLGRSCNGKSVPRGRLKPVTVAKRFMDFCVRCGIQKFASHGARHVFISACASSGMSSLAIAKFLGCSTLSAIEQRYVVPSLLAHTPIQDAVATLLSSSR